MTRLLGADCIERVVPAGRDRVVIDLFRGAGLLPCGTLIHDFDQTYRVERVLVYETLYSGARVSAAVLPETVREQG